MCQFLYLCLGFVTYYLEIIRNGDNSVYRWGNEPVVVEYNPKTTKQNNNWANTTYEKWAAAHARVVPDEIVLFWYLTQ